MICQSVWCHVVPDVCGLQVVYKWFVNVVHRTHRCSMLCLQFVHTIHNTLARDGPQEHSEQWHRATFLMSILFWAAEPRSPIFF